MKIIKYITGVLFTGILFSSCIKEDAPALGTKGSPFVKILQAPSNNLYFSPFSSIDTVDLFSLRREEVSPGAMAEAKTVQLTIDAAAITAYNDSNGTSYELLPDSLYTLVGNNNSVSSTSATITIPADEIGSEFYVALNGAKWDVTHKYALFLRITDASGSNIRSGQGEIFVTLEAKNQWDGVYTVEGTLTDVYNPTLGNVNLYLSYDNTYGDPPMQLELRTLSPTKCVCYDNYFYGGYYKAISVDNGDGTYGYSSYGGFCVVFEFDPLTNKVVAVTNYFGQPNPDNTRSAELDPSGENQYDASSKTIKLKYWMNQPSVITDPPYHRVSFDETWTYLGPRN